MYSFLLFLFLGVVSALPSPNLKVRQAQSSLTASAALASPTSVTTANTVQTTNGTMIETCVYTFIPVGQQIQEIKNCTVSMGASEAATTTIVPTSPTASPNVAVAFVMPGTSIQVLPVGLGIYGGITAIAVAVVAYVTWERVQSRKTFRRQMMVDGYGGVTKG